MDKRGRLSLAFRGLREIPIALVGLQQAALVKELDLSHNSISELQHLEHFSGLEALVLDNNRMRSHSKFPLLPHLSLLWVNSNQISNLSVFIAHLAENAPNLKIFSMLNNEACPNFFNGGTPEEYNDYRLFVICKLKNLSTLDSTAVTPEERIQAEKMYGNLQMAPSAKLREERKLKRQQEKLERKRLEAEQRQRQEQEAAEAEARKRALEEEQLRQRTAERDLQLRKTNSRTAASLPPLPPPPLLSPPPPPNSDLNETFAITPNQQHNGQRHPASQQTAIRNTSHPTPQLIGPPDSFSVLSGGDVTDSDDDEWDVE